MYINIFFHVYFNNNFLSIYANQRTQPIKDDRFIKRKIRGKYGVTIKWGRKREIRRKYEVSISEGGNKMFLPFNNKLLLQIKHVYLYTISWACEITFDQKWYYVICIKEFVA